MSFLEVFVDVVGGNAAGKHDYLGPVHELGYFFGEFGICLVFSRDPDFACFFDDFFAYCMHAFIEGFDGG